MEVEKFQLYGLKVLAPHFSFTVSNLLEATLPTQGCCRSFKNTGKTKMEKQIRQSKMSELGSFMLFYFAFQLQFGQILHAKVEELMTRYRSLRSSTF